MADLDPPSGVAARYSAATIDHFQHPRNLGRLAEADAIGTVDDAATETLLWIYLAVADGRVARATFRALGCSACIAAGSVATVLLTGRTVSEARLVDARALDAELGGLPADKRYCADLAAQAVVRALDALTPSASR